MKIMIVLLAGIILGGAMVFLYFRYVHKPVLVLENESRFSFEESEQLLHQYAAEKGWKILGTHNLKEKMEANGFQVLEAKVYDLCKPVYANEILKRDEERKLSPFLPCRIALFNRSNGKTYIGRMNSEEMSAYMPGVAAEVMGTAAVEIEDVLQKIIK